MPPTAVVVEPVQSMDYAPAIELVGEVRAVQRAVLSAEVGGRVVRIAHRVGERHSRNAGALVQINTADYEAVLAAAQGGLAQAQEALRMAEYGPRDQDIAAQEAAVAAAQAQYDQALDNLGRQQKLYEQGVIAESMLIAARTQADAAGAALDAQHEVLNSMLEGTRVEQLEQARAMVQVSESQVRQAELALGKTGIAPAFDAVVASLMVEVGSMVGPGTPVAEVVSTAPGEAWFNLPEDTVSRVDAGDAVELTFDALPGVKITGSVISVSQAADQRTRQFPVRVKIGDERPLAGMVAHGRILAEQPRPAVMISRDAVVLDKLGTVVFTMVPPEPGADPPLPSAAPVYVELGDAYGELVEVVSGELQPGMMVITRGNEQLYMGAKIAPVNMMGEGGMGGGPPDAGSEKPGGSDRRQQPAGEGGDE